jgi:hypothetical protein
MPWILYVSMISRHHSLCSALCLALVLPLLSARAAESLTAPASDKWELGELCSFYLDFESTLEARFAEGELRPTSLAFSQDGKTQYLPLTAPAWTNCFVPGLRGQALSTRDGRTDFSLSYPAARNFNSRQGSILFWMKVENAVPGPAGNMCFNVPGMMYINMSREVKGGQTNESTAIWFAPVPDVPGRNNGWMIVGRPAPWRPRTWHHVALTWGLDDFRYYEDGVLLGKQAYETGRPMPENMAGQFSAVLAGWAGTNHDTVVMDELCVFPSALTGALVQEEYERLKPAANPR